MSSRIVAEALTQRGFYVFPLKAGAKTPPLWKDWPTRSCTTIPDDWPTIANVGIHCVGMIVVDIDPRNSGFESLIALELDTPLPATLETITPSGGRHLFFRLPAGHPGVQNRAHALGRGIDVKSTNGYVVGAGSRTDAGEYRFIDPAAEIADAPGWLVAQLGVATIEQAAVPEYIPDADQATFDRAASWLKTREPAVEGCGGDAHTFATAAMLRDYGLSEAQTRELMCGAWNEACMPPWEHGELADKVAHAYAYAKNPPGSKALTADDFPMIAPVVEEPAKAPAKSGLISLADLTSRPLNGAGYVVKGLLQRQEYAMIYGAPGEGKTFVALDIAYHVAAGKPWMERKVHQGTVLYVGFEAYGGLASRALALKQHYGDTDVPLYFAPGGFNLRELAGRQALGALMASLPKPPSLIVFDTFAYALAGGDENAAKDVSAFNEAVQALIANTGACVLVIHHTGKDASRGARGSSALAAALDTELEIADNEIRPVKQRNVEMGDSLGFKLQPLAIGYDDDGDLVSSCVVIPMQVMSDKDKVQLPKPGSMQRRVWDVLCEARKDNSPISETDLRQLCNSFLPGSDTAARKQLYDAIQGLKHAGLVVLNDGYLTRKIE